MDSILDFLRLIPMILKEARTIVFLVDGLGSLNLRVPFAKKNVYQTVFPPSTPAFLYTLHSLLRPEEHCFLEWYMRFRDTVVTALPWEDILRERRLELGKDIDRDDVFPFKSLSEILAEEGFKVLYYTPFADSVFTKAVSSGAKVKEIRYLSEVFPLEEADFTLIYWNSVDSIRHRRYIDEAVRMETRFIELFVKYLVKRIPRGTKLYVLSDHGLVRCRHRYLLPVIGSAIPVGGERTAFYKGLSLGEVQEAIRNRGIPASVTKLEELRYFQASISPRCRENYGDIAVIARGSACFQYPFEKLSEENRVGVHGGTSKRERTVILYEYEKA